MRTPRLLRHAMAHAMQWRLIVASLFALALPAALLLIPYWRVLGELLDQHPNAGKWMHVLDSLALTDLFKQLGSQELGAVVQTGPVGALVVLVLVAPLIAGFALAAARSDSMLDLRDLIAECGASYGRLFRFGLLALVTLGLFAIPGTVFQKVAGNVAAKAVTEAAANSANRWAMIGLVVFLLIGQTIVDCGRALFAVEPHRRSALFAGFAGLRLFLRRPFRALLIGVFTWLLALLVAALFLRARFLIPQTGTGGMVLAFVMAQLAVASVVWGRATRLIALTGLARADALARIVKPVVLEMSPPETRPSLEATPDDVVPMGEPPPNEPPNT